MLPLFSRMVHVTIYGWTDGVATTFTILGQLGVSFGAVHIDVAVPV